MKQSSWRRLKRIFAFSLLLVVSICTSSVVYAADLPPGLVIGDQEGFYANSEGDYFVHVEEMELDVTYTKEITIRNVERESSFDVTLHTNRGELIGTLNLPELIQMTFTLDGEVIYEGSLIGNSNIDLIQTPISLGEIQSGQDKILVASFTLANSLTKEDLIGTNVYEFVWSFVATDKGKLPPTDSGKNPPSGKLPQTGEEWETTLYQLAIGLFIVTVVLLIFKKRYQARQQKKHSGGGADE